MLKQKRLACWTAPLMLQAALLSASPLIASQEEGDGNAVPSPASGVEEVEVVADSSAEGVEDSKVLPNPPVPKARPAKPRPARTERSDVRDAESAPKKEEGPAVIKGGRITVKSADGRTFEIVAPEGPVDVLHDVVREVGTRPGAVGRSFTILRTPDGEKQILEADQLDTLIDDLTFSLKDKIANETPRFIIGVSVSEAPRVLMVQLGRDDEAAVVVDTVMDDSPAATAGVKQFDVILKVAGEPVRSAADLTKAVKASDGRELEFVLLRSGQELKINITPRPNEPVRRAKVSEGVIHFGPAVMERRPIARLESMSGPGSLHEQMKALRKDVAELKEMVEKLKAER